MVPLSVDEALAVRKYRELLNMLIMITDYTKRVRGQYDYESFKEFDVQVNNELTQAEKNHLQVLRERLDLAILPFVERGGAAFVKLSTRSPKDAAFFTKDVKDYIRQDIELNVAEVVPGTPECDAEDISIFVRSTTKCLAVRSGDEAVQLLTRSQRVFEDIVGAELMSSRDGFSLSLVLREWDGSIIPEWEFRVFVQNNRLTSATQYNPICFVPKMMENEERIKSCISDYWDMVKGSITEPTYTLDLALTPEITVESTKIIEINAPPPLAGTSLFKWDLESDRKQIEEGEHFELRVNKSLPKGAKDEIHQPLRRYIDFLRGVGTLELVIKHTDLSCNECHIIPISKTWYECETCTNYDLCERCQKDSKHAQRHKFRQMGEKKVAENEWTVAKWCVAL